MDSPAPVRSSRNRDVRHACRAVDSGVMHSSEGAIANLSGTGGTITETATIHHRSYLLIICLAPTLGIHRCNLPKSLTPPTKVGHQDPAGGRVLVRWTSADRCGVGEIFIHDAPVRGSCFISTDDGKNICHHNRQFTLNDTGTFTGIYKILQYS